MAAKCTLLCANTNQRSEHDLSDRLMDMSSIDFSKCSVVLEDGNYDIGFSCDQHLQSITKSVEVCVNGEAVGHVILNTEAEYVEGKTQFKESIFANQPFLLHYDLITISFVLTFVDGSSKEYYTDYLLCVSKRQEDATNIQNILQEIIKFDDSQVGEWIFSDVAQGESSSLYEGKWNKRTYKSLSSYIQLLEHVISCYQNNYAYFKMQSKHTIKQTDILASYNSVKTITRGSISWIMQNADQLADCYAFS